MKLAKKPAKESNKKTGVRLCRVSLLMLSLLGGGVAQQGNPDLRYKEAPEWPIQAKSVAGTPAGPWNFGQVAAVATTTSGHVLVLHRGAHPLMEFDSSGKFISSWGNGMISQGKVTRYATADRPAGASGYTAVYGPPGCYSCGGHSVRVDPQGNIWIVDATAHVVYKMNQRREVLMQLGTKGVSGGGSDKFNLPTDVAFAPNGDLYVTDGYGSARVVKYSADGKYILQWGKRGTGPGEFGLPHNLVVDAQGKVYVTDRDNQRIQVFDSNGKFLDQWKDTGGVSTLFMTKDQQIWTGGVLRNLKGEVLARLPGNPGGHGTTVTATGDVFISQLSGVVQKFVKQ